MRLLTNHEHVRRKKLNADKSRYVPRFDGIGNRYPKQDAGS